MCLLSPGFYVTCWRKSLGKASCIIFVEEASQSNNYLLKIAATATTKTAHGHWKSAQARRYPKCLFCKRNQVLFGMGFQSKIHIQQIWACHAHVLILFLLVVESYCKEGTNQAMSPLTEDWSYYGSFPYKCGDGDKPTFPDICLQRAPIYTSTCA